MTAGKQLQNGDPFPALSAEDLEGTSVSFNELTNGAWSVILFYRGHW